MKIIKRSILFALFIICVLSFYISFVFMPKLTTATTEDVFEMEQGAQLALHKDGMRFVTKMSQSIYDLIVTDDADEQVSLSVLVSTRSEFDKITDGKYINLNKKIVFDIPDDKIYRVGEYYYANALLTNLNAENNSALNGKSQFDYHFVGLGVIVDNSYAQTEYTYADFAKGDISNNTRSQYDMIQSILLNNEYLELAQQILSSNSPYSSWFGQGDYPLVINTAEK